MNTHILLTKTTLYRNPNGSEYEWPAQERHPASLVKKFVAELGFLILIPFAVIETAISAIRLAYTFLSRNPENTKRAWKALSEDTFTVFWATTNLFSNLFCTNLIAYKENAITTYREFNIGNGCCFFPSQLVQPKPNLPY